MGHPSSNTSHNAPHLFAWQYFKCRSPGRCSPDTAPRAGPGAHGRTPGACAAEAAARSADALI